METAVKKPTLKYVRDLARQRHGENAVVKVNKKAMTAEQKAELKAVRKVLSDEQKAVEDELKRLGDPLKPLVEAARAMLNTGAALPAWDRLATATEQAERIITLRARKKEIFDELRRTEGHLFHNPYEVVTVHGSPFPHTTVAAQADTLAELMAKLSQ